MKMQQCNFPEVPESIDLCKPEPEPFKEIARNTLRPVNSIQCRLSGEQVRLCGIDKMCAFQHSPEKVKTEVNGDTDIVSNESLIIPASGNTVETIEENDQGEEDASSITKVGLEWRLEW